MSFNEKIGNILFEDRELARNLIRTILTVEEIEKYYRRELSNDYIKTLDFFMKTMRLLQKKKKEIIIITDDEDLEKHFLRKKKKEELINYFWKAMAGYYDDGDTDIFIEKELLNKKEKFRTIRGKKYMVYIRINRQ